LRKKIDDHRYISGRITLVEGIYDYEEVFSYGMTSRCVSQRLQYQTIKLTLQTFVTQLGVTVKRCCNGMGHSRDSIGKLGGDCWEEAACTSSISLAPFEEEACSQAMAILVKDMCDCARNDRLACTCHTAKPQYPFATHILGPLSDLAEQVDASPFETPREFSFGKGVVCSTLGSNESG